MTAQSGQAPEPVTVRAQPWRNGSHFDLWIVTLWDCGWRTLSKFPTISGISSDYLHCVAGPNSTK